MVIPYPGPAHQPKQDALWERDRKEAVRRGQFGRDRKSQSGRGCPLEGKRGAGDAAQPCIPSRALLTISVDWLSRLGQRASEPSHWLGICGQEEPIGRVVEQQSCREKGGGWEGRGKGETNGWMRTDRRTQEGRGTGRGLAGHVSPLENPRDRGRGTGMFLTHKDDGGKPSSV